MNDEKGADNIILEVELNMDRQGVNRIVEVSVLRKLIRLKCRVIFKADCAKKKH